MSKTLDDIDGWGGAVYDGYAPKRQSEPRDEYTVELADGVDCVRIDLRDADSGDWRPAEPDEVEWLQPDDGGAILYIQARQPFIQLCAAQAPDADPDSPGVYTVGGERETCPECGGTGEVDLTVGGAERVVECEACGGTGKV